MADKNPKPASKPEIVETTKVMGGGGPQPTGSAGGSTGPQPSGSLVRRPIGQTSGSGGPQPVRQASGSSAGSKSVSIASGSGGPRPSLDTIEKIITDPPDTNPETQNETAAVQVGRLQRVWLDLFMSEKNATAIICLHAYGYLVSIIMTLWGYSYFNKFGRKETFQMKLSSQLFGLLFSYSGIRACYREQPHQMIFFLLYEANFSLSALVGLLFLLFNTTRQELFDFYTTEPFYNMKLVDQPFVDKYDVLDMTAEPAYEVSLLYYRAIYMILVTTLFNCYTFYVITRKIRRDSQNRRRGTPGQGTEQTGSGEEVPMQELNRGNQGQGDDQNQPEGQGADVQQPSRFRQMLSCIFPFAPSPENASI